MSAFGVSIIREKTRNLFVSTQLRWTSKKAEAKQFTSVESAQNFLTKLWGEKSLRLPSPSDGSIWQASPDNMFIEEYKFKREPDNVVTFKYFM